MESPARPSQAKMASSTGGTEGSSPASSPASAASLAAMAAPKFGTLVPNRIFVGGISPSTSEAELAQLFSAYGTVKATKIIADRGGASKGYGFVTFETEEEATRLQQESECIVLRERKLNIAPAIKKQSFNRSFDGGSGSPPVVPTSTYYYANGMGLPYQNGMTFYNAGAPAPGAGLAPPTDPTTLYQAAGVFGPQATSSHQTFAPMMYPMPTPSIYMPQQYQYSPMPYEPYFPGAAAGGPPFMYTSNGGGSQNQSGGGSTGNSSGTGNGAGNSSSPYQSHLYGGGPNSHHALTAGSSGSQSGPPQSHQMEHIYYSYPPPHVVQQHQHHTGPLNMADQQLLIYSEIAVPPPQQGSANESLINQEETHSTSSHLSAEHHRSSNSNVTSDSGGGGGGGGGTNNTNAQPPDPSSAGAGPHPKYPRYPSANFHPVSNLQEVPPPPAPLAHSALDLAEAPSEQKSSLHYRGLAMYPQAVYHTQYPSQATSLLPTPPVQPHSYHTSSTSKYPRALMQGSGPVYGKSYIGHPPPQSQKYPRVSTPPARLQQLGRRPSAPGPQQQQQQQQKQQQHQQQQHHQHQQQQLPPTLYVHKPAPCQFGARSLATGYIYQQPLPAPYGPKYGFEYARAERPQRRLNVNNYRGSNLTMSSAETVSKDIPSSAKQQQQQPQTQAQQSDSNANVTASESGDAIETSDANNGGATATTNTSNTSSSTSPANTSNPNPNLSPSPNPTQVQSFGSQQQQQQRFNGQRGTGRYPPGGASGARGAPKASAVRQSKFKINGVAPTTTATTTAASVSAVTTKQQQSEDAGGGDAPVSITRLPLTPPGTPQQQSPNGPNSGVIGSTEQQIQESCHQIQALSL